METCNLSFESLPVSWFGDANSREILNISRKKSMQVLTMGHSDMRHTDWSLTADRTTFSPMRGRDWSLPD